MDRDIPPEPCCGRKDDIKEEREMSKLVTKLYVQARESLRGQTMTEYALIIAAVAVAALVAYQGLGNSISGLAKNVASDL